MPGTALTSYIPVTSLRTRNDQSTRLSNHSAVLFPRVLATRGQLFSCRYHTRQDFPRNTEFRLYANDIDNGNFKSLHPGAVSPGVYYKRSAFLRPPTLLAGSRSIYNNTTGSGRLVSMPPEGEDETSATWWPATLRATSLVGHVGHMDT